MRKITLLFTIALCAHFSIWAQSTDTSIGVETTTLENIKVYPNPVRSDLNIEIPSGNVAMVAIYDVLGKQVLRLAPNKRELSIQVAHLEDGVYFLKATADSGLSFSRKLIKQ